MIENVSIQFVRLRYDVLESKYDPLPLRLSEILCEDLGADKGTGTGIDLSSARRKTWIGPTSASNSGDSSTQRTLFNQSH